MAATQKPKNEKILKKSHLRHAEYYDMTDIFDKFYADSLLGKNFTNLMDTILSEENIKLAYRNIKRNTGSKTAGTDKLTMKHIEKLPADYVIQKVRNKLSWYKPKAVRRIEIPKPVLSMVMAMLEQAFSQLPDGCNLILHSDQGWQYQHKSYRRMLSTKGIRQSMSRKGNCLDNAVMENFFGHLKS